jgi:hypothetical protein
VDAAVPPVEVPLVAVALLHAEVAEALLLVVGLLVGVVAAAGKQDRMDK